ncbi:thiamine biosynthesis lipoprotein [Malonomonas rubra DSM 5091]|uniref:FAD:protein FMN transferase n=1 Tax=Malonomonas rubra DSM 5091 TaxID=1122189 RepID=A0A1M6JYB1_MALRU|nr:FAD:protein FMN transferase [Malonomonas rubra]SHJ51684.1 thiamine biosynthesis lipoprotein [Malonomonas rubra DSM 5091]
MFGRQWVTLLLVLIAALLWWRLPPGEQQLSRTALVMGTLVEIKAFGDDEEQLDSAISKAFAEMTRLEALLSSHQPKSEISRLSNSADEFVASPETIELISLGRKIAERSNGAFDMTLGALKKLWAIESENPQVPSEEQIAVALQGVGPEALQLDGNRVRKKLPGLQVDLGGIAKGYAVDRALALLRAAGITSASVNAGGDIALLGDHDGRPWRIGIQHPRKSGELLAALELSDRAVVSSGDYERFFEQDGIRYHHIFDPRSGQPARLCQSVTVVAADAASADALATAAFVLGPEEGLQLLEQLPDVEGLIIANNGKEWQTSGLPQSQ